jgi:hypothetical protein
MGFLKYQRDCSLGPQVASVNISAAKVVSVNMPQGTRPIQRIDNVDIANFAA